MIDSEKILEIAGMAGILILENGGETFRAEETTLRICTSSGYPDSNVIAFPTGLFITLMYDGQTYGTIVKSLNKRCINLNKLARANVLAREFESGIIDADTILAELKIINRPEPKNKLLLALIAAVATGLFTILYGGIWFDCIIGCIGGFVVQYISSSFKRINIYHFAISLIGGTVIALIAVTAVTIFKIGNIDVIIIGGIIPLLPGLAMTNAIRDTMMGDLVSGMARLGEVLLIAISIAAGVGVVLMTYLALGGTL